MDFDNSKKTYLAKLDKSKKGSIDPKALAIIEEINSKENYYTTSSCSGRVYLKQSPGKKNQTEWIKVRHDIIDKMFFDLPTTIPHPNEVIWLRCEPFILHVACRGIKSAGELINLGHQIYKKSAILSIKNKIVVEIRGSAILDMPFALQGDMLYSGDITWLQDHVNSLLHQNWERMDKFLEQIKQLPNK